MEFKTDLLLKGERDPLKRSEAINSIVKSISLVQNQILRDTYLHDCAVRMGMNEATLINTMNKFIREGREAKTQPTVGSEPPSAIHVAPPTATVASPLQQASKVEQMLTAMVIRHGHEVIYDNVEDADGNLISLNVAQYLDYNLNVDGLKLSNPIFARILQEAVQHSLDADFNAERFFIHHEDINISKVATDLSTDRYQLSQHAQDEAQPMNEQEKQLRATEHIENIRKQLEHLLNDFRMDYLEHHLKELQKQIATPGLDTDRLQALMAEYKEAQGLRNKLAKMLGNNIVV